MSNSLSKDENKPKDLKVITIDKEIYGFFKSRKNTSFENRLKKELLDFISKEIPQKENFRIIQREKILDIKTGNFIINMDIYEGEKKVYTVTAHGKANIINRNGKPYIKSQNIVLDFFYF
jgi:predicted nuclease of restriction endonuclease-like (RecB) superfamily